MNLNLLRPHSLKTKVTFFTLLIFVVSIGSLSLYVTHVLREDMQRLLGEQQLSAASYVASEINTQMEDRIKALDMIASAITPAMMNSPAMLQQFIDQRFVLHHQFNGGVFALSHDGTAIADSPFSRGRIGFNFMDRDYAVSTLKQGKATISRPVLSKVNGSKVFVIAVPVHNIHGKVIGALVGATDLDKPNFLDRLTENSYGKTGGYLLVAPQYRLVVTATDKSRIMQPLPPAGVNPYIDRNIAGYEGYTVLVNPLGVEQLASMKKIPVAGWYLAVALPTAEAFAPLRDMQQRMLLTTVLLTLLAGALIWWILRRQLSPMLAAMKTLAAVSETEQYPQPLPVTSQDEIGALIGGFNRLLKVLTQREEALTASESRLRTIINNEPECIKIVNAQGRLTQMNPAGLAMIEAESLEQVAGNSVLNVIAPEYRVAFDEMHKRVIAGETMQMEFEVLGLKGGRRWLETHAVPMQDHGETVHLAVTRDITERKEHEKQLEHIAHYDALTSLPNRILLADRLQQGLNQAQRRGKLLAVTYIDLDGFKAVNDTHGHETGDQLLVILASRMKQALREGDTLARLGGDEFVAVLIDLEDAETSVPLLTRLLEAAAQPVEVGNHTLQVSASLGVTFYPQAQEVDADQLLRQADQAMYQAKLAGKNRYHIFDAEQDSTIRGHNESLAHIRRALVAREFVLYYQPKVNMRTGKVTGAEALIRWQHPEKGLLPPAVFLPVIEDHPLAVEIGEWVIDTALTQMELWHAAGLDIPVSVNVGARQLQQEDFVARLRGALVKHPEIKPGCLELEVLETSALEDVVRISQVIETCREIGIMFALDDFGTGYSSLTYLKRLPVSTLKIDQTFVRDMLEDPDDLAILEGVLSLASAFRRDVIAEGVETLGHGAMLLQLGCEFAQGYGIARPMPAHEMPGWAATWCPDSSWDNIPAISRDDLPLLFAGIEHRAWVVALEIFLKNESKVAPPLNHLQCRFGEWLNGNGLARYGADPVYPVIGTLHRQVHWLSAELIELHVHGRGLEALARLPELYQLRDALLEQMNELMR